MKRALCAALMLLCAVLLSGCMSRQLEEQMLVIILGVDTPRADAVRLTVKVPSNAAADAGGQAGEAGEQMGYLLLEATGRTFSDAIELLSATTPRTLNFSQVREVVIGEEAAADAAFGDWLEDVYALPRMRPSAAVVVCRGEAKDFVEAQKPYVGIRLSRYIETTLSNYAGKGFVPTTTLGEALRDLRYGFRDPLLVCGGVNDFSRAENEPPAHALDEKAGELTRKSVNPVELFGAAATDGVSVSGLLTGHEMALLHLLLGSVQALSMEVSGAPVSLFARAPAALAADTGASPVQLRVGLLCDAHYLPGHEPDAEHIRQTLEKDVTALIRHLQAAGCDGLGFGNIAVRGFRTIPEWEAFDWRRQYQAAETDVHIEVRLRRN